MPRRRMSTHLLIAAAYLEGLPQGTKLVLMAVADSADEHTLESAPGLPKLRAWSGLGKSQALASVATLIDGNYLERIEAGRFGRRAVYRVFPAGVPAIPHPTEVAARYAPGSGPPDPTEDPEVVDDVVENSDDRVRPTGPIGSDETPSRVRPTGPLHASTSVSKGSPFSTGRQPTPSAASGFPGSRATAEEDRGIARRARGAHDRPCPFHPDQIVPCGRCAHQAAEDRRRNPDAAKQAAARIREELAAAKYVDPDTTQPTTEEPTP